MSLILRSLNRFRLITSGNRCLISTSIRLPQPYNPAVVFTGSTRRYGSANVASQENRTDSLQQKLDEIDMHLQKVGRITRNDVNDVINMLKTVRKTTSVQSLLMIRCCGNLVVDEYPENRMKMVKDLWSTLEELKIPLDISHFNALLRVYIENDYDFDPISILIDLEKRGIEPNRITYQRLIARFCNKGDISGATKILQFMKDKQMAINEPIFNSLMVCHFENKDLESAVSVLDMMRNANFEPTNDTYSALLCGYAKLGKINEIHKLLSELKNKDVALSDKHYLEIVYNLATNGHHEHVPQILGEIRGTYGYNQEAINMIFRLLIKNQVSVAYEVSKTMYRSEFDEQKNGVALINQMVNLNRSSDEILDVCKRLYYDGLNKRAIYLACGKALNTANLELALPLFEALQKDGGEIRQHFFWPFLANAGRAGNVDEVFRILDIIINRFNMQPNIDTLTDFVISNLNIETKDIIRRLQNCGIPLNNIILSLVISKLSLNNIKEAAYISTLFPATFLLNALRKHLVHSLYATSDVNSFIVIAKQIIDSQIVNNDEDIDVAGTLLFDVVIQSKKSRHHLIDEVISAYKNNKIYIQSRTVDRFAKTNHVNFEDILKKVEIITDNSANGKFKGRRFSSKMHIEFIEDRLEKAVQNEKDTKGLMSVLLLNYCQKREYEKLDDLLADIEKEHEPNFEFKAIHLANLIEVFSIRNDVEKVDYYLEKLKRDHQDFVLDDSKSIRIARLYIQNDMCDRAFDILQNLSENRQDSQSNWFKTDLLRSLFYLAEKGDEVNLNKLFDILQNQKLIVMSNSFLGPLVKVHLVKDDLDKAFSTFEMLSVKYKSTPLKNELTKALIASDDKNKLNKLIEIGSKAHGAMNMYSDLMFSYLEMDRVQDAKRILENHLAFCPQEKIITKCSRYLEKGEEKLLEDLLKVTKNVHQFHRIEIYHYLLQAYIKNDNVDKAYNLWLELQEDDVNPNDEFLANLGTFLKSHNQIVPFQIPEVSEFQRTRNTVTSSDINIDTEAIKRIRLAIFNNDLRKVEELIDQCYKNLTYFDKSNLIEVYSKNNYFKQAKEVIDKMIANEEVPLHRVLNYYVNRLSANGMVAECEELSDKIKYDTKRAIAVDNKICAAYVNANRADEYLDNMERELNDTSVDFDSLTKKFPFGAIMNLCLMNPELIEKYEKICAHFYKKGYQVPMNCLWQYYFIKEDFGTAKTIFDQYLKNNQRLMFGGIINEARRLNNEKVFEELLQVSKTVTFSELDYARLCYSYMQTLSTIGKVDGMEQLFNDLNRNVNVNNLPNGLVNQLTTIAKKNGLSFPLDELADQKVVQ